MQADQRVFLFLQGPHGPFFAQLARQLRLTGAKVLRVGFNAGDQAFWSDRTSYIPFRETLADWPETLEAILVKHAVTDIVLYGDTRPTHAQACKIGRAQDLRLHVFEEGYLRPYWISYERGGANGHSSLMDIGLETIKAAEHTRPFELPVPPSHWGDLRQHIFYGALYHWFVLCWNQGYPSFEPHRALTVRKEFALHLKRLVLMPAHSVDRRIATARVRLGGFPYHLALLQLEHDSAFQMHGPFADQRGFIKEVISGFAEGAPQHHHLVFKAHPLEDGRAPLKRDIREIAAHHGLAKRVHFIRGGKLARLLDEAVSAVTVNSTAGQQALWRGIPLRAFGASVYGKAGLVSTQPLAAFFANPDRPDSSAYRIFRAFLLATSQLPGSFYAAKGRRQVLRHVPDKMLQDIGPYARYQKENAADEQQLRLVK